jgi:hypothetical protein
VPQGDIDPAFWGTVESLSRLTNASSAQSTLDDRAALANT